MRDIIRRSSTGSIGQNKKPSGWLGFEVEILGLVVLRLVNFVAGFAIDGFLVAFGRAGFAFSESVGGGSEFRRFFLPTRGVALRRLVLGHRVVTGSKLL